MTVDEAVLAWARYAGPVGATDIELEKLGLLNPEMALQSLKDDKDDDEDSFWDHDITQAYGVLLARETQTIK